MYIRRVRSYNTVRTPSKTSLFAIWTPKVYPYMRLGNTHTLNRGGEKYVREMRYNACGESSVSGGDACGISIGRMAVMASVAVAISESYGEQLTSDTDGSKDTIV